MCVSVSTEWSIERQVLHGQCKRLEAQNYNLTRTAEQLSVTMGVSIWDHICMYANFYLLMAVVVVLFVNDAQCSKSLFCNESHVRPLICQELVTQRQKVREERERLQAQLEHFRRCLTLPNIHWGRGQVNGHTLRWPLTPTPDWYASDSEGTVKENKTDWSQTTLYTWSTWRSQSCSPSAQSIYATWLIPDSSDYLPCLPW